MSTADDILSEFGDHQCAICGTDCVAVAAALDAIPPREPTEAMINAAIGIDLIKTGWQGGVAILWKPMYHAALAEKEGK